MTESPCATDNSTGEAVSVLDPWAGRLVIVTGISGAGVGYSIEATRKSIGLETTAHVRLDEDYLVKGALEAYGERLTRDLPALSFADLIHKFPDSVCYQAWPRALRLARADVERELALGKIVFLQIHMTLLHNESRSVFSAVDPQGLKELVDQYRDSAAIVCIIDDVYDTYMRLSRRRMIYSAQNRRLTWKSQNIREILAWRAMEIRVTQLMASLLNLSSPFTVLAAKHSVDTFKKVLDPKVKQIYLSHPITPFRRQGQPLSGSDGIRYVEEFARQLRRAPDFVIFEPTTIDELRFTGELVPGYESFNLRVTSIDLAERWPKTYSAGEERLCDIDRFTEEEQRRIESSFFRLSDQEIEDGLFIQDDPQHLDSVVEEIRRQISSRDRLLINQSDAIVALIPFAAGSASEGMTIEIDYRQDNAALLPHPLGPAVLVHAREHEHMRLVAGIRVFLESAVGEGRSYEGLDEVATVTAADFTDPIEAQLPNVVLGERVLARLYEAGFRNVVRNLGRVEVGASPLASDNPGAGEQDIAAERLAERIRPIVDGDTKGRGKKLGPFDIKTRYQGEQGWMIHTIQNLGSPQNDAIEVLEMLRQAFGRGASEG